MTYFHNDGLSLDTGRRRKLVENSIKRGVYKILKDERCLSNLQVQKNINQAFPIQFATRIIYLKKYKKWDGSIPHKWQAPLKIIKVDGTEKVVFVKKVPAKWFIKNKPKNRDSWSKFAARYGKQDELETKWKSYKDYCMSNVFKKWKKKVLERANYKCQGKKCKRTAVSAHHLIYRRWGQELVSDGLALCWSCHMEIHKND